MPTMREVADMIREINGIKNPKLPVIAVIVRKKVVNNDTVFEKLVPPRKKLDPMAYNYREFIDYDEYDPWNDPLWD